MTKDRDLWMLDDGYECVEPDLGRDVCLLDDPNLPPERRLLLEAHLEVCEACRLYRALVQEVGEGLGKGRYRLPGSRRRLGRWSPALVASGSLSLAACLLLLLVLPPRPRDGQHLFRGGSTRVLIRPVEGEVVNGHVRLQWRPVPEATAYRVVVEQIDGAGRWQTETEATGALLPGRGTLPRGRDYRARLEVIPPDVAPAGGFGVSFRSGTWYQVLAQRWQRGPLLIRILGGLGALLAGWGAIVMGWRR